MDCDEMELKVTKNREKTADEMFEELGYSKLSEVGSEERLIVYRNCKGKNIRFSLLIERVMLTGQYTWFDMQELQAINKKVEELGWK
jgi:hypothetical protein